MKSLSLATLVIAGACGAADSSIATTSEDGPAPALRPSRARALEAVARWLVVVALVSACSTPAPVLQHVPVPSVHCDAAGSDADHDSLSDTCETNLAVSFAPMLRTSANACNVINDGAGRVAGGGYLHAVSPIDGGARIMYLPAYYRDCGWSGFKCQLPGVRCGPHAGDSEFIAIDVAFGTSTANVTGVFLSAHCFDTGSPRCRWYRDKDLAAFKWLGPERSSAPVVWVADGKGANYPTRVSCDAGHWFYDTCDDARNDYRFPVRAARNVGSRPAPLRIDGVAPGCVPAATVDRAAAHTSPGSFECVWDVSSRFRGWQGAAAGATSYERYLREIGGL